MSTRLDLIPSEVRAWWGTATPAERLAFMNFMQEEDLDPPPELAIRMNDDTAERMCPTCRIGHRPRLGPVVTDEDAVPVCDTCSREHAPRLTALVRLGEVAAVYAVTIVSD